MRSFFTLGSIGWGRLAWAGVLLAVLGFITYAYWPQAVPVDTALAKEGPLRVLLEQEGEVRAHDRYVISAPVAGRVQRIEHHNGDLVQQGDVVATVLPLPLSARERDEHSARLAAAEDAIREAEYRWQQTQAQAAQAQRERTRVEGLVAQAFVSPQAVEQVRLAETRAQAETDALRLRVHVLRNEAQALRSALRLQQRPTSAGLALVAPAAGRILRIENSSERVVAQGTPLLTIGDPQHREIVADVLSQDAVRLRTGMAVEIQQWGGTTTLAGRIRTVEPYAFSKVSALGVEEKRVNVIADLDAMPDELGDGYRVNVAFVVWHATRVLKIPTSALFRRGTAWAVFIVRAGRAHEQVVNVGERNAEEAQILQGLQPGDRVVLYPGNSLRNGMRVTVSASAAERF